MKEVEAKDFDLPGIEHENTPTSVRVLKKNGANHLKEIPDNEVSFHVSSSWNVKMSEWKALALACKNAGYNAQVSEKSIAVW